MQHYAHSVAFKVLCRSFFGKEYWVQDVTRDRVPGEPAAEVGSELTLQVVQSPGASLLSPQGDLLGCGGFQLYPFVWSIRIIRPMTLRARCQGLETISFSSAPAG